MMPGCRWLLLILCWWAAQSAAWVVEPSRGEQPLGQQVALLEDPARTMTLAQALEAVRDGRFRPSEVSRPNLGFSSSDWWAYVELRVRNPLPSQWWLEVPYPPLQNVDVFLLQPGGGITSLSGGSLVPYTERPLPFPTHVFPLSINAPGDYALFVKVSGETRKSLPLVLWRSDAFLQASMLREGALWAYFGALTALCLYNLALFAIVRERMYAFYSLFVATFVMWTMMLNGYLHALSGFDDIPARLLPALLALCMLFAGLFSREFLGVTSMAVGWQRGLNAGLVLSGIIFCACAVLPYRLCILAAVIVGATYSAYGLVVAAVGAWHGRRAARYYLVSWACMLVGLVIYALMSIGLLPSNLITDNALYLGSALEGVLLSVALADRLRTMKAENESAQRVLLEKARFANLGLLSAGVAHEINNPNNFVRISVGNLQKRVQSLQQFIDENLEGDDEARDLFRTRFMAMAEDLSLIDEGTHRIQAIVSSMRGHSRSDAAETVCFDAVKGLLATVDLMRPTWPAIDFDVDGLNARAEVNGQGAKLNQVFTNLLVNACHAIEEKAGDDERSLKRIRLHSVLEGPRIRLTIEDSGCGMTPEVQRRLFEPFFTTKGAELGSGLGMGICRNILEEHGGRIEVESVVGVGTSMHVILPVAL